MKIYCRPSFEGIMRAPFALSPFLCAVLLTGCATSHLEDGKESVVKFTDGGISAEELYEKLLKQKHQIVKNL